MKNWWQRLDESRSDKNNLLNISFTTHTIRILPKPYVLFKKYTKCSSLLDSDLIDGEDLEDFVCERDLVQIMDVKVIQSVINPSALDPISATNTQWNGAFSHKCSRKPLINSPPRVLTCFSYRHLHTKPSLCKVMTINANSEKYENLSRFHIGTILPTTLASHIISKYISKVLLHSTHILGLIFLIFPRCKPQTDVGIKVVTISNSKSSKTQSLRSSLSKTPKGIL